VARQPSSRTCASSCATPSRPTTPASRRSVSDDSSDPPLLGRNQPAIHGLEMVDRLVNDWGYQFDDDGEGKTVWADVAMRSTR
jgi:hypothetical protein